MNKHRLSLFTIISLAISVIILGSSVGWSEEFPFVGARMVGMGATGVAVVDDSTALYWNPGVRVAHKWDVMLHGEIHPILNGDVVDVIDDIIDLDVRKEDIYNDPDKVRQVVDLLNRANEDGFGGIVNAGFGATGSFINIKFGLRYYAKYAFFPIVDLENINPEILSANPILLNGTQVVVRAFETQEFALSYSLNLFPKSWREGKKYSQNLSAGLTGRLMMNTSYYLKKSVWDFDDISVEEIVDEFSHRNKDETTTFDVDVGIHYRFDRFFFVGLTIRHIAQPEIDFKHTEANKKHTIKQDPLARLGVGLTFLKWVTITADLDITSNETLIADSEDQRFSVGIESKLLGRFFRVRGGGIFNLGDKSESLFSAGFSLGPRFLTFDVGGAYDFAEREGIVALSITTRGKPNEL